MNRPWMPLYIGDYLADTAHLRAAESGAYIHLIMHYWRNDGLPDDDVQLAAIARMTAEEWRQAKALIEPLFKAGRWKHKRIEVELAKARQKVEAGQKGGLAKAKRSPSEPYSETPSAPPSTPVSVTCESSSPDSQKEITEEESETGDTRAREPLIAPDVWKLADEIARIVGHDPEHPPPQWCGSYNFVDKWLREGWNPQIILAAVRRKVGSYRGSPILSITFFERAIAEEHARHAAPLPKVKIAEGQEITIGGTNGQARNSGGNGHTARSGPRTFGVIAVESASRAGETRRERAAGDL